MTVWKLDEWLGLTEAGVRVSEYSDWNEQHQLDRELWGWLLVMRRF